MLSLNAFPQKILDKIGILKSNPMLAETCFLRWNELNDQITLSLQFLSPLSRASRLFKPGPTMELLAWIATFTFRQMAIPCGSMNQVLRLLSWCLDHRFNFDPIIIWALYWRLRIRVQSTKAWRHNELVRIWEAMIPRVDNGKIFRIWWWNAANSYPWTCLLPVV